MCVDCPHIRTQRPLVDARTRDRSKSYALFEFTDLLVCTLLCVYVSVCVCVPVHMSVGWLDGEQCLIVKKSADYSQSGFLSVCLFVFFASTRILLTVRRYMYIHFICCKSNC